MVPLICFLSGAAALIFESVWFHRASLVFGSSVWSTSLVLSSFMAGLTLGSALVGLTGAGARGALATYARVETAVAAAGVALTIALPGLTSTIVALTSPGTEHLWATNLIRFVTAFLLLLLPSTAMGASLPLLVGAMRDTEARFGAALGSAYGWNTFGAVAGVLGAEVWLVGTVGIAGAAWCAAAVSLAAAALALTRRRPAAGSGRAPASATPAGVSANAARTTQASDVAPALGPLLACAFLSGAVLLGLEIVWFRFLTLFILSTSLAASLMVATVLAGIALGGLIGGRCLAAMPAAPAYLPAIAAAGGIGVTASYAAFDVVTTGTQIAAWHETLWLAGVLTLPTSVLSGVLFTMTGAAVQRVVTADTRAVGWLGVANTAGGICGPLVAAFVMLPAFGTERTMAVLASSYLVVAALAWWGLVGRRPSRPSGWVAGSALALVGAIALFPYGAMRDVHFTRVSKPYERDGSTIMATREGASETIFLMQQQWLGEPVYTRLVTNGFSMSGTSVPALRYMRYFAYWPAALHRGPLKRALVICFGLGVTAGAVLDLPSVETLDVAEISSDIVAASDLLYSSNHPLRDSRVRLHVEDGRQFLERTTDRFDLITGEPPPPRTPGAVNIYTREYFQLIRDRLAEGGITTYWLPVGRPDPGTNVTAIMRAFCDTFTDCSLWNATPFDLMLVGSRGAAGQAPPPEPVAEDDFVRPWTVPALRSRLVEIGLELPQQLGATFLGDAEYLRELTAGASPLDDDHPQRLRPVRGQPSLSDPGYGVDAAVTELFRRVMDPGRARQAFEQSAFIRARWPPRVREASLPYFAHQATLNEVLFEGGHPLARIETLHRLLADSPLRTLPLWLLGSDDIKAGIAARRDDGSGAPIYARGLSALAVRDYAAAAAAFGEAEARGLQGDAIRPLRVYALCVAGQTDAAKLLAATPRPANDEQKIFWEWMSRTCGV